MPETEPQARPCRVIGHVKAAGVVASKAFISEIVHWPEKRRKEEALIKHLSSPLRCFSPFPCSSLVSSPFALSLPLLSSFLLYLPISRSNCLSVRRMWRCWCSRNERAPTHGLIDKAPDQTGLNVYKNWIKIKTPRKTSEIKQKFERNDRMEEEKGEG